ncbi:MAG TPA: Ig-like domain-containing protein [Thermoanaerobaculia bacterium]|nr:Ig-like domain-containing protein [Thermoanaerobaculia bacterium]
MNIRNLRAAAAALLLAASLGFPTPAQEPRPELNETCTVSILNRSTQVAPDGGWVVSNVPTNVGLVRARATCVENGITRVGQSDYFAVAANGLVNVAAIRFDAPQPIPATLVLASSRPTLTAAGATAQITATAVYADNRSSDVTGAARGTNFFASNPAIASIDAAGLVTARGTGTVLISAMNEGALGLLTLTVVTTGDADGDGLPDDYEISNGLDANNPADAQLDLDQDGLTNLQEFGAGTNPRDADSDGDGIRDGEETAAGVDGYVTNPLLADTDADGIRDGLEVQTGSDPTSAQSTNLARALSRIDVTPASATLIVNVLAGEAYTQLTVAGRLLDGTSLDLTSTQRGTRYTSSDLTIASFGFPDGRVFAGGEGAATIAVENSGFTATVAIAVRNFAPLPLGSVTIPGYANAVDAKGSYAFVAAGSAGLQVVDLSNPAAPAIVASHDTPGNANDVRIFGNYAYVADGFSGLQIIDIANPLAPATAGAVGIPGGAFDVAISGGLAYVAAGSAGLVVVNVSAPSAPIVAGSAATPYPARGIDVSGTTAVVAGDSGACVINIANPAAPQLVADVPLPGTPNDVRISNNIAAVACYTGGLQLVDIATPAAARVAGGLPGDAPLGFIPLDVSVAGPFALAAEVLFVNAVPIADVSSPAVPVLRATIDFQTLGDFNGTGIAVQGAYVLMTGSSSIGDRGSSGFTALFIGQYLPLEDRAGNPPQVRIAAPPDGSTQIEEDTISVTADATDDVAVSAVTFTVDGQAVFTDTSAPYEAAVAVPAGVRSISLGASALDLGGNSGIAAPAVLNVVPDPRTTVTGTVVDASGAPIAGAVATTNGGATAQTASDGAFTIPGVSTIRGAIIVSVQATAANGDVLTGSSAAVAPVRGGTTDAGRITAVSAVFETNYGTFVTQCDDCSFPRTLPFSFPYFGAQRTASFVGTNGYITFDEGDSTYSESLPAFTFLPRIAAFFDDLIGGGGMWINDQLPGRFVVTYDRTAHYSFGGSNTLQIILFADGRIQFGYAGVTALSTGSIAGITPGAGAPFQQLDYSATASADVPAGTSVYEYFTSANRFDLDGGFVIFTPRPDGGYNVRTILQPPPPDTGEVTNEGGGGVTARVQLDASASAQSPWAKAEVEAVSSRDRHFRVHTNADRNGVFRLRKVPAGGIEITLRKKGRVIGRGSVVVAAGQPSYRVEIAPLNEAPKAR